MQTLRIERILFCAATIILSIYSIILILYHITLVLTIMNDDELHFTNYILYVSILSSFHDEPQVTTFSLFALYYTNFGPLHIDHGVEILDMH